MPLKQSYERQTVGVLILNNYGRRVKVHRQGCKYVQGNKKNNFILRTLVVFLMCYIY